MARPPRAIWTHPYDDDQYLFDHPEVREMLGKDLTVKMLTLDRSVPVCAPIVVVGFYTPLKGCFAGYYTVYTQRGAICHTRWIRGEYFQRNLSS